MVTQVIRDTYGVITTGKFCQFGVRKKTNIGGGNGGGIGEIPSNEMYFTTSTGNLSYIGNVGDIISFSDGTTYTVLEDGGFSSENVPSGKHKVKLVSERMDGHVGIDGEALVELHNFPELSTVTKFSFATYNYNEVHNLTKVPEFFPSNIVDISELFYAAVNFNQDISMWDVSNVTNMSYMFYNGIFNQPLNNWNVSNVTNMGSMFEAAVAFDQDISMWDISNVTDISYMFSSAIAFDHPLNNWDTSNVTSMNGMFNGASAFNQPLNNWDTSNVLDMSYMFDGASAFNQPLNNWDFSKVTNMACMFQATNAFNHPLNNWDVSNVTDMSHVFGGAIAFNYPLNNWDVSKVTNMDGMFEVAKAFNQDISMWDVSNVNSMNSMFWGATTFNQDLGNWCVSNIPSKPYEFDNGTTSWSLSRPVWGTCPVKSEDGETPSHLMHFTTTTGTIDYIGVVGDQIVLNDGNTFTLETEEISGITVPSGKHKVVFAETRDSVYVGLGGEALIEINNFPTLSSIVVFDTCPNNSSPNLVKVPTVLPSNLTRLSNMFDGATSFNQDISMWDTSNVTEMYDMFEGAISFNQDLSGWCVSNITSLPVRFDDGTTSWTLPKPVWGTCPV